MPTDTKNSTAKASRSGSDFVGGAVAELATRAAPCRRRRRPARNDTPNSSADPSGDARRAAATTHSVNSSREPVRDTCHSSQGSRRRPTTSISTMNTATLRQGAAQRRSRPPAARRRRRRASNAGQRRQQHQHQHHDQVLDHQPADGDAAVDRCRGQAPALPAPSAAPPCWPPTAPGRTPGPAATLQPHLSATPMPSAVAMTICTTAPGSAMRAHRQQVVEREVQADAEHQQHHADLGQLRRRSRCRRRSPAWPDR